MNIHTRERIAILIKKGWFGDAAPRINRVQSIEDKTALEPFIVSGICDLISRGWDWRIDVLVNKLNDNYWHMFIPSIFGKIIINRADLSNEAPLTDRYPKLVIADNGRQRISVHYQGWHWGTPQAAFNGFRQSEDSVFMSEHFGEMMIPLVQLCGEAVLRNRQDAEKFPAAEPAFCELAAIVKGMPSKPFIVSTRRSLPAELRAALE